MKKFLTCMIIVTVLFTMLVLLTGCSSKVVINVYNWGDYIDETLIDEFEKVTGIRVNYKTYSTNEELLAKMEAGGSSFDVVFPSDYAVSELIKRDMLIPLNFDNIPNYKYVDERFKGKEYDPEDKYSVPYFWGTIGILYNKDMVEDPVDSWDILWNQKYKGQILMKKDVRDTMGVALKKLGYSMNSTDDSELAEAKAILSAQSPLVIGYYGDEIRDLIANGDAAMGVTYSGDAMDLYWEGFENIDYAVPKEGTNIWYDTMVIPKSCKHKEEAEKFINFMLDPDVAYRNVEAIGYTSPNSEVLKRIEQKYPEVFELPAFWPDDEILSKSEVYLDLGDHKSKYNDIFTQILAE
ncbi:MAG: spermidine/putrescine ABC transporter substrate-binding protein [Clostridiaceae bacterium]|jgi:spermidine/putrescine transport system substrate-binding protein|nr:spermidine/putrescine ABC transporter substrate-binding protein [Clostridiaceae bacterium]